MIKRISFALILLLPLAGCQQESSQPAADNQSGTEQAQATEQNVVLRVNGTPITEEMVAFHLQRRSQGRATSLNEEQRDALLDELIDLVILAQAAEEQGLDQDPAVRAQLRSVRHALLAQAAIQERSAQQEVSDEQVQAEYDAAYGDNGALEYRARHILLESEEDARQVIQELDQGAEFAALAQERSTGPSAESGGDLGWFQPEQMVEPFAQAVAAMDPGQYSQEPVQTQFGWHVILLEESRPLPAPKLEEVEPQIRGQLAQEQIQGYVEDLRQQAQIEYLQGQPQAGSSPAGGTGQPADQAEPQDD